MRVAELQKKFAVYITAVSSSIGNLYHRSKPHIEKHYTKLSGYLLTQAAAFKKADHKGRFHMLKYPLLAIFIIAGISMFIPRFKPPTIISWYPSDKSVGIDVASGIEVIFDKSVIKKSAEESFFTQPSVKGTFEWKNDQSVTFTPTGSLERGKKYIVGFKSFTSTWRMPSFSSPSVTFETLGRPSIVFKAPEIETPEGRTPITVIFSQPMVPLMTATDSGVTRSLFKISPLVVGTGRWLGTSAYQYMPSEDYHQATTYSVSILPDIKSQDGLPLDKEYSWTFSGMRPRVVGTNPPPSATFILPTASISAELNVLPDTTSLSKYFVVTDGKNNPVEGSITLQGTTMHLKPSILLKRGALYKAVVKKGLKAEDGPNAMEDDYSWTFNTLFPLSISYTWPANGEQAVENETSITISFNADLTAKPSDEDIIVEPPLEPISGKPFISCDDPCSSLTLNGKLKRSTPYKVIVKKGIQDKYGSTLGSNYTLSFKTAPLKTSISLIPGNLQVVVLNQRLPAVVHTRTKNVSKISYELYRMTEKDFLEAEVASTSDQWRYFKPSGGKLIKQWKADVKGDPNEFIKQSASLTDEKNGFLTSGYYFFRADVGGDYDAKLSILVSNSTLTIKSSKDKMLIWGVDQSTNQVVSDMKVKVLEKNGAKVSEGVTNKDGVAILSIPPQKDPYDYRQFYIFGTKDNDVTVTGTRWNLGIGKWDFGLASYNSREDTEYPIYIVTDRPLYRPGQQVFYKGILRKDTDGAFQTIAAGDEVEVSALDAQGRSFITEKKILTSFGTFSGSFTVGKDGNVGLYTISAKYIKGGKDYRQNFQVEEYKRPEFKVEVKPSKDDFVSGDNLNFSINSSYYFGAPVKNADTFYTVKTEDYYFHWDKNPQYEFGQPDSYWYRPWYSQSASNGKSITESHLRTNNLGNVDVNIPLDMASEKQSKRVLVEASVTDINNQVVGASEEMFFHKSKIYVGIKPKDYVNSTGKDAGLEVVTLDPRSNTVRNIPVTMDIYKVTWVSVREEDQQDGSFYYRNKAVENLVTTVNAATDEYGYGTANFVPKTGGTYKVVAKASDDRGNSLPSQTYFWVDGDEYEATRENHDRIPLVTDKYSYEKGETAKLFIGTPFGADTAKTLITYERGSILDYKVIDINEKNTTYSFQVNEKMMPNVYMSAVLIRGSANPDKPPEFKMGYTELRVNDNSKKLTVEILTDKDIYSPRDHVSTTLQVKDAKGQPHKAELSLALVDRSLLDLASLESTQPYSFFFEPRQLGIDTAQSLIFSLNRLNANVNSDSKGGDGDDQSKLSTKRKFFPETNYWGAHLVTDANGRATIDIPLADNLTTWKFTAVANTDKDAFGMGTKEILATKDVLIRPFTPRFLSVGDQSQLGAILVNKSEKDMSLSVELTGKGLQIIGSQVKTVQVSKGEQVKLTWNTLAEETKQATINITTRNGNNTLDDVELSLPIVVYHTPETTATSGEVQNEKTEKVRLPKDIVPNKGNLDVNISSSLLGSSLEAMSYVIEYPYGCVEQTTSSFYPAISAYSMMKEYGIKNIGNHSEGSFKNIITLGTQKLYNEQKSDGGWSWWVESLRSDPFLTAYAYKALSEAKDAGFAVTNDTLQRAESYLMKQLGTNNSLAVDTQSYIVYVLRNTKGVSVTGYMDTIFDNRDKMSTEGKAYLLASMYKKGGDANRKKRLKDEIISLMKKSATGVHWEEGKAGSYNLMGDDTTATAAVLEALLEVDSRNPIVSEVARFFQASLRDGHWRSTRSTSAVLHSLVAYSRVKGDFGSSYEYKTLVDGKDWKNGKIDKNDLGGSVNLQKSISSLVKGADTIVRIIKKGTGNLYYNMNLRYYLPYTEVKPLERGFTILREYEDEQGKPVKLNKITASSLIRVKLTIVVSETRHKTIVEDRLPAGIEALNENLKGTSSNLPPEKKLSKGIESLYYDRKEYRDDRVAVFTDMLSPGVYEFSYLARATTPGKYHHPPAQVYEMYMPDVMGHTEGGWFEVVE